MSEAGWGMDKSVKPAIDELKDQVQKIYNAGYAAGRVAGVQEAVPLLRSVREWLKQLNDRFEAEWPNTARHTGLHIRQIDAWFHERQIEAQAQGGSVRCQRCGGSGYTQSDDPARPLSRCGTCLGDGRYQPSQAQGGEHGKG